MSDTLGRKMTIITIATHSCEFIPSNSDVLGEIIILSVHLCMSVFQNFEFSDNGRPESVHLR